MFPVSKCTRTAGLEKLSTKAFISMGVMRYSIAESTLYDNTAKFYVTVFRGVSFQLADCSVA